MDELVQRAREKVADLWLELQLDYEKREWALYAAAGLVGLLALLPNRRSEERRARLLGEAIANGIRHGGGR